MSAPLSVAFHTLGCKLNYSETSSISRLFEKAGYGVIPFQDSADVYVINTCSVTEFADRKCRQFVRRALRSNPDAFVVVIGCYAQLKPQEIAEIQGVDLVLGAKEKFQIVEHVDKLRESNLKGLVRAGEIGEVNSFFDAFSFGDRTRSFLKVQDGCDYKCSFCTIPLARGKSRSDALDNVINNAEQIAALEVKEVVLTGVNIGDYRDSSTDCNKTFIDLIKALDRVEGIERFRISSIEPNLCSNEIIDFVSISKRFMPHFHMPLQSGNDEMLKTMRRRYKRELYRDRVDYIKEKMPHACIGVDVIVGFPGETEEHFLDTYRFLQSLDISYLHVFTYSERPNTRALELPGTVPMQERRRRNDMLRILSDKKRRAFYESQLGQHRPVLLEKGKSEGMLNGFTDNYVKVEMPGRSELINKSIPVFLHQIEDSGLVSIAQETMAISD